MKKTIVVATLTYVVSCSYAQTEKTNYFITSASIGYMIENKAAVVSIPQIGYRFENDIYVSFKPIVRVSADKSIPFIFAFNAGYNISQLQPFLSYSYHFISKENKGSLHEQGIDVNTGWLVGYGVAYYFKYVPLSVSIERQGNNSIISASIYKAF